MFIKIIGIDTRIRRNLETILSDLKAESASEVTFEMIDSLEDILSYDVQKIPAISVDEKIVFEYSNETEAEIRTLLSQFFPTRQQNLRNDAA